MTGTVSNVDAGGGGATGVTLDFVLSGQGISGNGLIIGGPVVVGAGGAGGAPGSTGATGGDTHVTISGGTYTAKGGFGGVGGTAGGVVGGRFGGQIQSGSSFVSAVRGAPGGNGFAVTVSGSVNALGGQGGSGPLGIGGISGTIGGNGGPAFGSGAGGGGGATSGATTASGGGGTDGAVYIYEYA
jgi:hypothetical protein